jgi:hypothetical protein
VLSGVPNEGQEETPFMLLVTGFGFALLFAQLGSGRMRVFGLVVMLVSLG